jgi:hypothetical protein
MGDIGDFWRDIREERKRARAAWVECPTCKVRYGTGTKNPPGFPCRNCGWVDPAYAVRCVPCDRWFKTAAALADHTRAKHEGG